MGLRIIKNRRGEPKKHMEPNNSGKKTNTTFPKMPNHLPKWPPYALLIVALVIVIMVIVLPVTQPPVGPAKEPTRDEPARGEPAREEPARGEVLSRLAKAGAVAPGEPTITKLAGVGELKRTKPVIYQNAKDGQYEARWPTLLVIYDYENDSVVNSLSITQVRLPE